MSQLPHQLILWRDDDVVADGVRSHAPGIDGDVFALVREREDAHELVIGALTLDGPEVRHRHSLEPWGDNVFMTPLVTGGRVTASSSEVTLIVDVASGEVLARSGTAPGLNGHLQRHEDRLLVLGDNHHGVGDWALTGSAPETLGEVERVRPPMSATSPYTSLPYNQAYADGRLFVRGYDGIYAFDLRR